MDMNIYEFIRGMSLVCTSLLSCFHHYLLLEAFESGRKEISFLRKITFVKWFLLSLPGHITLIMFLYHQRIRFITPRFRYKLLQYLFDHACSCKFKRYVSINVGRNFKMHEFRKAFILLHGDVNIA